MDDLDVEAQPHYPDCGVVLRPRQGGAAASDTAAVRWGIVLCDTQVRVIFLRHSATPSSHIG